MQLEFSLVFPFFVIFALGLGFVLHKSKKDDDNMSGGAPATVPASPAELAAGLTEVARASVGA